MRKDQRLHQNLIVAASATEQNLEEAEAIYGRAVQLTDGGVGLTATPPIIEAYSVQLDRIIQEKHEQAERLEDRLELMLQSQSAIVQRLRSEKPGWLSSSTTRTRWQMQFAQAVLVRERIEQRVEQVREIMVATHLHGHPIELAAIQKLAFRYPELDREFRTAIASERIRNFDEAVTENGPQVRKVDESGRSRSRSLRLGHGDPGNFSG